MTNTGNLQPAGPHQALAKSSRREVFVADLFDRLWARYRERVEYVRRYEQVVNDAGATFVNDHIAFRTFANQSPLAGISSISRVFEALGYCAGGCYTFPDKHLGAIHFQHPNGRFPKIFISELKVWELGSTARRIIERAIESARDLPMETLVQLHSLDNELVPEEHRNELLQKVVDHFHDLPWELPSHDDVTAFNDENQYAAWVLVHGYNVNHFTSLINSHQVSSLDDIEKTIAALAAAGVPMKKEIEGEGGSKLRQTATEAVVIDVDVLRDGRPTRVPWSYAYFELAERGTVMAPESGQPVRFEGFLGPQATNLFEMTRM